jgi:hypothetical protein
MSDLHIIDAAPDRGCPSTPGACGTMQGRFIYRHRMAEYDRAEFCVDCLDAIAKSRSVEPTLDSAAQVAALEDQLSGERSATLNAERVANEEYDRAEETVVALDEVLARYSKQVDRLMKAEAENVSLKETLKECLLAIAPISTYFQKPGYLSPECEAQLVKAHDLILVALTPSKENHHG